MIDFDNFKTKIKFYHFGPDTIVVPILFGILGNQNAE